jgi:hypothetical protein
MPRYKTPEGIVVELDEGYAQTLPSLFEPVPPDTPVSPRECCGGTGWIVNGRVVHPGDPVNSKEENNHGS